MLSFKEFFNFNKRQERGILVLSVILIVVILTNYFAPKFTPDLPKHVAENAQYLKQVKLIAIQEEPKKNRFSENLLEKEKYEKPEIVLYPKNIFDPNSVAVDELIEMGMPSYIANNIEKYRSKGGTFKKKQDLAKIYGITEAMFQTLEPFIHIEEAVTENTKSDKVLEKELMSVYKNAPDTIKLGINTADSTQFLSVRGIGSFYAGEIVNYRKKLGGYIHLNQILELYKMDTSKFNLMKRNLFLDTIVIEKIDLNQAEFKEILRHPYIDYETTKYIVNKRKSLGKFAALYQLKDSTKMPETLYNKLLPYITIDK